MSKKSDNDKSVWSFFDSALLLAGISGAFFLLGKVFFEGYLISLGIPTSMVGYTVDGMITAGAVQSLLVILIIPAVYYFSLVYITKSLRKSVRKRINQWTKKWYGDLLWSFAKYSVFWLLLLLPLLFFKNFIEKGKKAGLAYLEEPIKVRYLESSEGKTWQEAILLCRDSGRYFLRPTNRKEDVSFVIFEEGELSQIEVLQKQE